MCSKICRVRKTISWALNQKFSIQFLEAIEPQQTTIAKNKEGTEKGAEGQIKNVFLQ